ncbi:MAG TPA: HlyD family secretion protein, partial [Anaerolineae bacterium]|nr:HlyD family secretion protein [Anaerolineae bacterium]
MAATFSRSMRALAADNFRTQLLGLLFAAILFAMWAVWFFFAQVGVYEVSQAARLHSPTQAIADFPAATFGRIRPGQPARLRLAAFPWTQYGTLSATVATVDYDVDSDSVRVGLDLAPGANSAIRLEPGLRGNVEVEIERVSPAVLAVRAAGR